jgi:glutathione S-transferase
MILYYSPRSPFVRKVMIALHETGLTARVDKVRAVTMMLKPNAELMKVNPWNKIPTFVTDDGQVLFDSDVIIEYLDTMHTLARLHPQEASWHWKALRWRAFGSEMLDVLILWRNERERQPERKSQDLIDVFALKLNTGLEFLEREAAELATAPFSVGHIAIGCALGYMEWRFAQLTWREQHPSLLAWFSEFKRRPSVVATEPFDDVPRHNAAGAPL